MSTIDVVQSGLPRGVPTRINIFTRHDPFENIGALFAMYPDLYVSEAVLCRAYRASPGDYRAKHALAALVEAGKLFALELEPRVYAVPGQEAGYEELKQRVETLVTSEPGRWWRFDEITQAAFRDDPHDLAWLSVVTALAMLHAERRIALRIPEANPRLMDTEYGPPPPPPKRFYERLAEGLGIEAEVVREAWNAAVDAEKAEAATS
jgi:hypothetical protein